MQLQEDRDLGALQGPLWSVGQSDRRPAFTVQTKAEKGHWGLGGARLGPWISFPAAVIKDHKLGGLKQQIYTLRAPGGQKSKIKVSAGRRSSKANCQGVLGGP